MEIQRLRLGASIRDSVVIVYSLVALVEIVPEVHLPSVLFIPYYLLVPGYCISLLLGETRTLLGTVFFSVCWSIAAVASIASIGELGLGHLPIEIAVPLLTIVVLGIDHLKKL